MYGRYWGFDLGFLWDFRRCGDWGCCVVLVYLGSIIKNEGGTRMEKRREGGGKKDMKIVYDVCSTGQ
jgi:hypothetical protein